MGKLYTATRWPARPQYRAWLRDADWGRPETGAPKWLRAQRDGFGNEITGTDGWSHHSDRGKVLRLVQELVQQGYPDADVAKALMNPARKGGLWLRRHDDPDAALADMLGRVKRTRRPHLPLKEIHRRVQDALRDGPRSQRQLLRAVDNAHDGNVRSALRALVKVGALAVAEEQHGQVTWLRYRLVVKVHVFWDLATALRKELARKYATAAINRRAAAVWRRSQGVLKPGCTEAYCF